MRRLYENQLVLTLKKMPKIFSVREFWDKVNYKGRRIHPSEYQIRKYIKENCKRHDRFRWRKKNK